MYDAPKADERRAGEDEDESVEDRQARLMEITPLQGKRPRRSDALEESKISRWSALASTSIGLPSLPKELGEARTVPRQSGDMTAY